MFLTNLSLKTTVSNIPELKDYKCIFVQIIYLLSKTCLSLQTKYIYRYLHKIKKNQNDYSKIYGIYRWNSPSTDVLVNNIIWKSFPKYIGKNHFTWAYSIAVHIQIHDCLPTHKQGTIHTCSSMILLIFLCILNIKILSSPQRSFITLHKYSVSLLTFF